MVQTRQKILLTHRNLELASLQISSNLFNVSSIWLTTEECVVSSTIAWYHTLLELWMQDWIDMPVPTWLHASTDFHLRCTSNCFQFCPAQLRAEHCSWEHAREGSRVTLKMPWSIRGWKWKRLRILNRVQCYERPFSTMEFGSFDLDVCFEGSQGRDSSRCLNSDASSFCFRTKVFGLWSWRCTSCPCQIQLCWESDVKTFHIVFVKVDLCKVERLSRNTLQAANPLCQN